MATTPPLPYSGPSVATSCRSEADPLISSRNESASETPRRVY